MQKGGERPDDFIKRQKLECRSENPTSRLTFRGKGYKFRPTAR